MQLPGPCLPGGADVAGGCTHLAAGRGFNLVVASGQGTAGTQNPVGTFPEVS
jgi:hypothetical protein